MITSGLSEPLFVTAAPGDNNRLFILEKGGNVRLFDRTTNTLATTPYLTVPVSASGERGLLGLAFAPDFATSGAFYVQYSRTGTASETGDMVVARYSANGTPLTSTTANPTGTPLLTIEHTSQDNHNGGWIGFSPNNANNLYIATGDGGGSNDPNNNGQNTSALQAKILRIGVSSTGGYTIPAGNPFASGVGGAPEVWAYGVRNPFRNSFDRGASNGAGKGDFYIADVGQGAREEVNFQAANAAGGANYGWRAYEGSIETPGREGDPNPPGAIFPIHEYDRSVGRSITGGYVYRGAAIPDLQGTYFFGDFSTGKLFSFNYSGAGTIAATNRTAEIDPTGQIGGFSLSSFGEDAAGELYLVDINGQVYRLVPEPSCIAMLAIAGVSLLFRRRR